MKTRYHVAPSTYQDGDDLLSLSAQIDAGLLTDDEARAAWKWEHDYDQAVEVQFVSLWTTPDEARAYQAEHGGVVLSVDVDGLTERTWDQDAAPHPYIMGSIDGDRVTRS